MQETPNNISTKYPNLGGHYFSNINGMDINKLISQNMTDSQREGFFKIWDVGYKYISVIGFPKSVIIAGYKFSDNNGKISISQT